MVMARILTAKNSKSLQDGLPAPVYQSVVKNSAAMSMPFRKKLENKGRKNRAR
jgi:hypothetical protein